MRGPGIRRAEVQVKMWMQSLEKSSGYTSNSRCLAVERLILYVHGGCDLHTAASVLLMMIVPFLWSSGCSNGLCPAGVSWVCCYSHLRRWRRSRRYTARHSCNKVYMAESAWVVVCTCRLYMYFILYNSQQESLQTFLSPVLFFGGITEGVSVLLLLTVIRTLSHMSSDVESTVRMWAGLKMND